MADFEPKVFRSPRGAMQDVTAKGEILREDPASHKFRLWKLSGVPASQELPGSDKARGPRAVSSNGQWIAAAAEGESLLLWQLMPDGGVAPPIVLSSESATFNLGFSPGDRWLAAAYSNGDCRLWDLNDPKATPHSLTNLPDGGVMAFAPGDDRIATAGWDDEIHLRVLDDKGPRTADSPHHPKASFTQLALAFSADGEWLAVGGLGNRIRVWKASGHEVFLEERSGTVGALAFSPDGRWLAAGGEDGTVQLWRWAGEKTNSTPIVLAGQHGIDSVVFTPQGLLSSSRDGTVRLWELRTGKLIKLACQSAGRTLSRREWDTYLLSETYEQDEPCPGMPKAPD
jgi:WD40 repeat protein